MNAGEIDETVEGLRRLAEVLADPKARFYVSVAAGMIKQLATELEAEHDRVLTWRTLGTDIWVCLNLPRDIDAAPGISGWMGAYQRQLERDRADGCLK